MRPMRIKRPSALRGRPRPHKTRARIAEALRQYHARRRAAAISLNSHDG